MPARSALIVFDRFHNRTARVAVVGLGYVGLPLAVALAASGYEVVGIDLDPAKIQAVNQGRSYIADVADTDLLAQANRLRATSDYAVLSQCDAVSICLPTPLDRQGQPDVSAILASGHEIASFLHPGLLVVLESTSYPGTTTDLLLPRLEAAAQPHGWRVGDDFYVAFSPERVDPGRTDWTIQSTPKIIAGVTGNCLSAVQAYYGPVFETLVPVSSPSTAEMAKLFENTYRFVNISLVNELLLMCDRLGLDCWEVLDAAATKPFGFSRFTPGPGVGGPCIPVDPHFLAWKMKSLDAEARFIELAGRINAEMPNFWVQKVQVALNDAGKALRGSRVLVLGAAYKPDVADARESPVVDILQRLLHKGAQARYHDPYILSLAEMGVPLTAVTDLEGEVQKADCVVIATAHSVYDWASIAHGATLVVDTRFILKHSS
ncbi:MAG: nucleotide sugar dehydrogenase [Caldilineaceae bacterium SB0668_bin_21]|nr:nucleotide sugar dehydrogenase [Caldilineaceae bacterium SB0668_bin_21]MYC23966.1 nucleotide sugar dehydrogenase [Caldilineaceae bacterium SB0662_bin_25]